MTVCKEQQLGYPCTRHAFKWCTCTFVSKSQDFIENTHELSKKKVKWNTSDWWMVRLQTPCQGYWKVMVLVKLWSTGAHAGTQVCLTMIKTWPVAKLFWETRLAWYHMLAVKLDACLYIIFNFLGFLIFSGYQIRNSVLLKIV